jgi:hypothetical protein
VSYKVYADKACAKLVTSGTKPVTAGKVSHSAAATLPVGTYYWRAAYGGDAAHKGSATGCGAEVLRVLPVIVDTKTTAIAERKVTAKVSTTAPGDLLVAFVEGDAPAKGLQYATVSGGGLTWKLAGRDNAPRADAEVWVARATGVLHKMPVTVTGHFKCCDEVVTVIAFKNAVGLGAVAKADSALGAPTVTMKTRGLDSWAFASGVDWKKYVVPTPGPGQGLIGVVTDHDADQETFWTQGMTKVTPKAGTAVTINDTSPVQYPYNLVLVEIR